MGTGISGGEAGQFSVPFKLAAASSDWAKGRSDGESFLSESVLVWSGTWNIAGLPIKEDISSWLMRGLECEGKIHLPDIFYIGLQEVVGLNDGKRQCGYAMNATRLDRQCTSLYGYTKDNVVKDWRKRIEKALTRMVMFEMEDKNDLKKTGAEIKGEDDPSKEFCCIFCKQMVGVCSLIYVRKKWRKEVQNIKFDQVGTGFMGVGKNKGAIGTSFQIRATRFLMVNAHLESGQHAVEKRNSSFKYIKEQFLEKEDTADVMIFLGDLNYRLDLNSIEKMFELINNEEYKILLQKDQLKEQMANEPCFKGMQEAPISFPPTYKMVQLTNNYDWGGNGKKRLPAWCDRILYFSKDQSHVTSHFYTASTLVSSDHKPVSSLFEIKLQATGEEEEI